MLLAPFSMQAQGQASNPVPPKKKLTSSDFKGAPDPRSGYLATTFTNLAYQYRRPSPCTEKGKLKFEFETAVTVGNKSWMKFDKIKTKQLLEELLAHEQGHYDIAEALSFRLQQTLSSSCFNRTGYASQIDSVYKSVSKKYDTLQSRYDVETGHGLNREMQARWKTRIDALR